MTNVYNGQLDAFSLYHKIHEDTAVQAPTRGPALPALGHALSGATGSAISNLLVFPLDLVITRLQVQQQQNLSSTSSSTSYTGLRDAAQKIYAQEGGLAAFYTGVYQDTSKSIADAFLFFLAYTFLRQRQQSFKPQGTPLSALEELSVGAAAGAFAKFFTTPLANIVTRKQTAAMHASQDTEPHKEPSTAEIAQRIRLEKGIRGFWAGYSSSLVLTLNPSITFFAYEFLKRSLLPSSKRTNPGARLTFLFAALSKALATSLTYPFTLAKARAQASSSSSKPTTEKPQTAQSPPPPLKRLYAGLLPTLLKAILTHGTTMLIKNAVHASIISAYVLSLRLLSRYPSPEELLQRTSQAAGEKAEAVREGVRDLAERGGKKVLGWEEMVGDVVEESLGGVVEWVEGEK
ncbi:MAG: hypothetical protein M1814_002463 [Vezdaea aestivalis]|nr:MAG: hypothetical protein M1814_002463 [Vezdaea aestivalis]